MMAKVSAWEETIFGLIVDTGNWQNVDVDEISLSNLLSVSSNFKKKKKNSAPPKHHPQKHPAGDPAAPAQTPLDSRQEVS